ncbi:hypothetical protein ACLB2K_041937 [Fragaria x ananassa]
MRYDWQEKLDVIERKYAELRVASRKKHVAILKQHAEETAAREAAEEKEKAESKAFLEGLHQQCDALEKALQCLNVYNLFRQLGLRHILVVPRPSRVIGLITRKDLLIEENEDSASMELQSTSVRAQHRDKRKVKWIGDMERPLLTGLLS